MKIQLFSKMLHRFILCLCLLLSFWKPSLAQKVQTSYEPLTAKNPLHTTRYIYFKIKDGESFVIPDFKKGATELSSLLATLNGFESIETIHRPFAVLKTEILVRTYRIAFSKQEDGPLIIKALETIPFIEFAVPDVPVEHFTNPKDLYIGNQWALQKVNMEGAWNITHGNSTIKIAVVDDGFMFNHEDLAPVIWTNPGETPANGIDDDGNGYIDDVHGWDVADNDNDPSRPNTLLSHQMAHGTACASIGVGATNNYKGIAASGYGCTLIPVKGAYNSPAILASTIWDGIAYAIAADADVVSMSWGAAVDVNDPLVTIWQAIINSGPGVVFVAAAGNSDNSIGFNRQIYPASLSGVISVGSSTYDDKKSDFSNYGSIVGLDIMAPGEHIYCATTQSTSSYDYLSGTSMSCPLVAGVCALIKANNPTLTPSQIETCLLNGAKNIDNINPAYTGQLGAGRLDAKFAVSCSQNNTTDFKILNSQQACINSSVNFAAVINNTSYVYDWNFGDGNTASISFNNSVSHTYTTTGLYTVSLSIKLSGAEIFQATRKEYVMATDCAPINSQNANWYFGNESGLNFSSGKPVRHFNNVTQAALGTACISNASSNTIEFYGVTLPGGYEVRNSSNTAINTSPGFNGGFYTIYNPGGLILEKPGTPGTYTIFPTADVYSSTEFRYYNAVSGAANTSLTPTYITVPTSGVTFGTNGGVEIGTLITAIKDCNGDYWIITRTYGNSPEKILVYRYTASGIAYVNSHTLPADIDIDWANFTASPDGRLLAFSYSDLNNVYWTKIYNFNRITGDIQDFISIENTTPGFGFSPNSRFLYQTIVEENMNIFYQIDLQSPNPIQTKREIAFSTVFGITDIQLGPDDILYINYGNREYLGAIYFPDNKITDVSPNACGYAETGVSLVDYSGQGNHSGYYLPNDIDATEFDLDFSFVVDNCNEASFTTSVCAPSYYWVFGDGQTSNLQNPTHTYSTGNTYTVQLWVNGQVVSKSVTTSNAIQASISLANEECDRSSGIILRASPAGADYTYTWYKDGIEIPYFDEREYLAGDEGVYTVKVVNIKTGCENTSSPYTYDLSHPLTISMVNPGSFTGANTIDLTSNPAIYSSYEYYTWYRDGEIIYNTCTCPVISVNLPGVYRVKGMDLCGEETSAEFRLKIDPNCSSLMNVGPASAPGNYQVLSNSIWPVSVPPGPLYGTIINGTVTIPSGSSIGVVNSNLIMNSCSKIVVEPGGRLDLINVNITGCASWEGIIVQGASINNMGYGTPNTANGILVMDNCYLSDAAIGVYSMNNGYINITNSEFDNNAHHIVINHTAYTPHFSTISGNTFKRVSSSSCAPTYYVSPFSLNKPAIVVDHALMVDINNNNFVPDVFEPLTIPVASPFLPYFNNRSIILYQTDNVEIDNNHFNKENVVALYATNSVQLNVTNNSFWGNFYHYNQQMTGMYIENAFVIAENNEFRNCYSGFEYYNTNYASYLRHNNFEQNKFATIVAPQANPLNTGPGFNNSTAFINLTIDCNKYLMNTLGIVGNGNLVQQGNTSTDASNMFNNMEWNILWQWPFSPPFPTIDYYYGTYTDPNALTGPAYNLNGVSQSSTDITTIALTPPFYSCYGSWKKDITSVQPAINSRVSAYPNPFTDVIEVRLPAEIGDEMVEIKVTDMQGKMLFENVIKSEGNSVELSLNQLSPGIYLLTVHYKNEVHQVKLVKTNY